MVLWECYYLFILRFNERHRRADGVTSVIYARLNTGPPVTANTVSSSIFSPVLFSADTTFFFFSQFRWHGRRRNGCWAVRLMLQNVTANRTMFLFLSISSNGKYTVDSSRSSHPVSFWPVMHCLRCQSDWYLSKMCSSFHSTNLITIFIKTTNWKQFSIMEKYFCIVRMFYDWSICGANNWNEMRIKRLRSSVQLLPAIWFCFFTKALWLLCAWQRRT